MKNQVNLPAKDLPTVNTSPQTHLCYVFHCLDPIFHFNCVSKLYSGSISDKEIVNVSGFLEKLNPGDAVMAEKGFNIQDLLALHNTVLMAPPMMCKNNVSAQASTATRRVAISRVHIERMFRQLTEIV